MEWTGTWKNEYGSELVIANEANGKLSGTFRTALEDSGFYGQTLEVTGITQGACINFAFAGHIKGRDMLASFSGILLGDRMETMWFVVAHAPDKREPWPHAVSTNRDTFTRVATP
jgi:Avidin family